MTLPKKVLLAVTSFHDKFYPDGRSTGAFYSEALHPYEVLAKHGFEFVVVSENGDYGWDSISLAEPFLTPEEVKVSKDTTSPLNVAFKNIKKASEVDPKEFGIFFAVGGHGTCVDFETAKDVQNLASEIYQNGGIVASVCHGPVILAGVKDLSTGELLAKGRNVTGFTDRGEEELKLTQFLKDHNYPFVAEVLKKAGGKYSEPKEPWDDYSVADGRLVTGANPASATSTAEKALAAYNA
ncbi:Hsp31p [Sugiyamaella lignohabitans]|uniref:D-lactate dehydratase n=1 Tax=Sugiyamaella lignohabitans TaxID=796027 RepID=A0A167EH20_9ASCO|nr:Hsp31p [Sugiyamaella lignohabitans]ANB14073.1 Hsp31p [Sugiyamaella lignohabitans]